MLWVKLPNGLIILLELLIISGKIAIYYIVSILFDYNLISTKNFKMDLYL